MKSVLSLLFTFGASRLAWSTVRAVGPSLMFRALLPCHFFQYDSMSAVVRFVMEVSTDDLYPLPTLLW